MTAAGKVREWIKAHDGPFQASQVAEETGLAPSRVRSALHGLMQRGEVEKLPGPKTRRAHGNHGWGRWCERCWRGKK